MHQEGRQPRSSWRPRRRDRHELGVETKIAALEAAWHDAERTTPAEALAAAAALADELTANGRESAAEGLLMRALATADATDPALPSAGLRLGNLAFASGNLDVAARGYRAAIDGGIASARVRARHGLFLAARGEARQALRQLSAALLDPDGPDEISRAAHTMFAAAQTERTDAAIAWAYGAREGFRVTRNVDMEAQAQQLVSELRMQMPAQWSAEITGEHPAVVLGRVG